MFRLDDNVPSSFNPPIVAASYFSSLVGCLLTVELLHRRGTGVHNLRSWFENLYCAASLGIVGIWCMHFIGNRAIVLGDGSPKIQLVYSPQYITLSAFLPIIGLSIAFAAAEYPSRSPLLHWTALTCTGVFAGLSVVGMHYIGNFGISNYKVQYVPRFLAASIIIAIGDCLLVLVLFYTWREKWISAWWKRVICATLLASGVSAMHFTASTNGIYRLRRYNGPGAIHQRDLSVIVAGVMVGIASIILIGLQLRHRHRARVLKRSAQKVVLACVMFDNDGRILVTTEGVLPSKEITDKYIHRTFNEEFDTAHPVFQWIFRVTRNWSGVSELIPRMQSHIAAHRMNGEDDSGPTSSASSAHYDPASYSDYSVIFRERFCTAAAALASSMHISVQRIGVLYDGIIETGTLNAEEKAWKRNTLTPYKQREDVETGLGHGPFGKGQLLFLTRLLSDDATDKLLNAGFKFAQYQQVSRNIAENMQIPLATLELHMSNLRHYVDNLVGLEKPGTWLSCFAMIPKANSKGFDVVVKKTEQDQLPDVQLDPRELLPWQAAFLERMDGASITACKTFLEDDHRRDVMRVPHERQFARAMLQAINILSQKFPAPWFSTARFYGKPLYAHYSRPIRSNSPLTTLYTVVLCADLHSSIETYTSIARVPLSFFSMRQQCFAGSPNHEALARDIHQEFGPLLTRKMAKSTDEKGKKISIHIPQSARKLPRHQARRPSTASSGNEENTDTSSDTYVLVDKPRHLSEGRPPVVAPASERDTIWGGIMVNSETVITSDSHMKLGADFPSDTLGIRTAVTTARPEDTFVDELVAFAKVMIPSKAAQLMPFSL